MLCPRGGVSGGLVDTAVSCQAGSCPSRQQLQLFHIDLEPGRALWMVEVQGVGIQSSQGSWGSAVPEGWWAWQGQVSWQAVGLVLGCGPAKADGRDFSGRGSSGAAKGQVSLWCMDPPRPEKWGFQCVWV
jgi:hypothetical protein